VKGIGIVITQPKTARGHRGAAVATREIGQGVQIRSVSTVATRTRVHALAATAYDSHVAHVRLAHEQRASLADAPLKKAAEIVRPTDSAPGPSR